MNGLRVEKLRRDHAVERFSCGKESLDRFLHKYAWTNQQAGSSQTYLALDGEEIVGYFSLAVGEVGYDGAVSRLSRGLARHPIPIMLLARLAVASDRHGQGLGSGLLKDALRRTLQAAEIAGIRAIVVHALDETARAFYGQFGFESSPTDPLHLYLLMKDVRQIVNPGPM